MRAAGADRRRRTPHAPTLQRRGTAALRTRGLHRRERFVRLFATLPEDSDLLMVLFFSAGPPP